jgi:kanamycin kinase/aminoglycoside 3'-phosphotransferase-2
MELAKIRKSLPGAIAKTVAGYNWQENHIGYSETKIFHLTAKNKASLYLKIDPHSSKFSLFEEKRRLDWLNNRLPVPASLLFEEDETNGYLLISEIRGVPAIDDALKTDIPNVVRQLVEGLKMIHAIAVEDCPFNTKLEDKIETARERMLNGLVEEEDFDAERLGKSAEEVFREMIACVPDDRDLVFTHGDYCVPNVILDGGRLSGFVDWAEAGIADRFQDLALLSRSVRNNFGEEYQNLVFELYGIQPDQEKIRFYLLLDEFF